jgi:hypothetical protein
MELLIFRETNNLTPGPSPSQGEGSEESRDCEFEYKDSAF